MLCDLSWKIHILKDIDHLNRILQNVHIIPLCISNISDISDKNISVTIRTANKNAKLFSIEDDIVGDDRILLDAFADTLINEKVIENALEIVPDEVIDLEPQRWSSPTNYLPPLLMGKRKMDYDDLINEWAPYQVDVETNGLISYSFAMLRPGENKWLSPYLIVVPKGDSMVFEYTILSEYSEKKIRGCIEILTTKTEL